MDENRGVTLQFYPLLFPKKAGVRQPFLILSLFLGTPQNARVTWQFHPLCPPPPAEKAGVTQPLLILCPCF